MTEAPTPDEFPDIPVSDAELADQPPADPAVEGTAGIEDAE